jgi:hypothetical protein
VQGCIDIINSGIILLDGAIFSNLTRLLGLDTSCGIIFDICFGIVIILQVLYYSPENHSAIIIL